jgi:hypothetical protein
MVLDGNINKGVDGILLSLVQSVLGKGELRSRNNYAFYCPKCRHPKRKLEVNMLPTTKNENRWNCWTCSNFKGTTLKSLFYALKVNPSKFEELNSILGTTYKADKIKVDIQVELPKEFKPFIELKKTDITSKHALKYLIKDRGITFEDIIKYNLGYCETGRYKNKIIIPSYSKEGKLDYFVARSFEEDAFQKMDAPQSDKNIIVGFESTIDFSLPIILCEGVFDAISIKRNAIPLFGKTISPKLKQLLYKNQVKNIYIALDEDALKNTFKISEELISMGKKIYVIRLNKKDPNELGFIEFTKLVQKAEPFTFSDLIKLKMEFK